MTVYVTFSRKVVKITKKEITSHYGSKLHEKRHIPNGFYRKHCKW